MMAVNGKMYCVFVVLISLIELTLCGSESYGPPPKPKEETAVEIQKVEVYEVPWIADQNKSPSPSYGPPDSNKETYFTTENSVSFTTLTSSSINDTLNSTVVSNNSTANKTAKLEDSNKNLAQQGEYFIYHPTGLLQKITYLTKHDEQDKTFFAQLKYKNVDPLTGPIYTYDPQTYVFSKINKK